MQLGKYLKAAFANRWNLLALFGGLGFAMLSGAADVVAPFVLAAEVAYLGLLGTHPKFQSYVDAQAAKAGREENTVAAENTLREILASLPKPALQRFKSLRERCLELQRIAQALKTSGQSGTPLEEFQIAGLDRLLWIYLRLLFTQDALGRFLHQTDERAIERDIADLEQRLQQVAGEPDETQQQKIRKALEDNLQTCRDRLSNYRKARDNFELMELEIDRLENKIQSVSELAVNRQEPDYISGQVDQVTSSMVDTERTMNELQFVTGLHQVDDAVPPLLQRETVRMRR